MDKAPPGLKISPRIPAFGPRGALSDEVGSSPALQVRVRLLHSLPGV